MSELGRAVLTTIAYRDVFNFPLSASEVWQSLISQQSFSQRQVKKTLEKLVSASAIDFKGGYYFLPGRRYLVKRRQCCREETIFKWRRIKKLKPFLRFLPGVWAVYVTGSVAQKNAEADDDIDLLIITAPDQLWWTRFWVWLGLVLSQHRRLPRQQEVKDLFCVNLFLAANKLEVEAKRHNLFTAVEIAGAKLVWSRPFLGKAPLLAANNWVSGFLVNIEEVQPVFSLLVSATKSSMLFNKVFYLVQRWYMKPRRTKEEVTLGQAFFHPQDAAGWIKKAFFQRLKVLKIKPDPLWF